MMSSSRVVKSDVKSNGAAEEDPAMKGFRNAAMQTVAKSTNFFRRSLIPLYSDCPPARREQLEVVCGQLADQLSCNAKSEIQVLIEEHQLSEKFRHLSLLKKEQMKWQGQRAWRPSGEPSVDLEDHLYPPVKEHKELLQCGLEKLKKENSKLEAEVLAGRLRLETRNTNIERITRKLQEVANNFANEVEGIVSKETPRCDVTNFLS